MVGAIDEGLILVPISRLLGSFPCFPFFSQTDNVVVIAFMKFQRTDLPSYSHAYGT